MVIANAHVSSITSGNYIDKCSIEWTNEYDPAPEFSSKFSFNALSVTDNVFLSGDVAPWFSYIVMKPHGVGHLLKGVSIFRNCFKSLGVAIDRVERVDTSFADLEYSRMREINFADNSFHGVNERVSNLLWFKHTEGSAAPTWAIDIADQLPFKGRAWAMDSMVVVGRIRKSSNSLVFSAPYVDLRQSSNLD
ncbi:hypothetical protein N9777_01250 [Ascidiaceihabitans sp.]|nr:hypothetical protein [Ascidiaceihabitans sp.]